MKRGLWFGWGVQQVGVGWSLVIPYAAISPTCGKKSYALSADLEIAATRRKFTKLQM